jgi:hypothetical protein
MTKFCAQCGGENKPGETCLDRFYAIQLQEQADPAYYAVHHLSVPCYCLQHNLYSRRGWLEVWNLLAKIVHEGWTPAMARRENRVKADSGKRDWNFTRGEKLSGVEKIHRTFFIMDVRSDSAEHYCADVVHRAETVLVDSEKLVDSNCS